MEIQRGHLLTLEMLFMTLDFIIPKLITSLNKTMVEDGINYFTLLEQSFIDVTYLACVVI